MSHESDGRHGDLTRVSYRSPRELHLWDLPRKRIFALLDTDYRRALVKPRVDRFGEAKLAKLIDVRPDTLRSWTVRDATEYSAKTRRRYIRLDALFRLGKISGCERFSRENIERHVIAIKGYGCSLPAYGTRFPIHEGPSLIRLLMHFIGDGFICPVVGSNKVSAYSNNSSQLRKQFITCLNALFGDISWCVREDLSSQTRPHVKVARWIALVLAHFYPDVQFGQLSSRLPQVLFSLPRELKTEAIRT